MKIMLDRGLESLALMVFLIYIQVADMAQRADWLLPYLLSSSIGVIATFYVRHRRILLNRLLLGITLYFCSGLLGLVIEWDWLNNLYGKLGAVAMLGWILITGVVTSLLSPYGFLGVKSAGYFSIAQGSGLLLLACAVATLTATYFMQQKFIFLFSMRSMLLQLDRKLLKASATAG
jgi:hypothetical protein